MSGCCLIVYILAAIFIELFLNNAQSNELQCCWLTFIRVKSSQVIFYLFIIRFFFIILFCLRIFLFSRNIFLLINIYWVYFFFWIIIIFFTVLRLFFSLNFTCFFAWNFINFFCNFLYWILVLVFFFYLLFCKKKLHSFSQTPFCLYWINTQLEINVRK